MRAVRCDACGAKAMMAAAKCPSCGHLFELRDGFGELLPLAYCSSCDSYYPESHGECKWCGTKPERPPNGPLIWRIAGAAALAIMVGAAFVLRHSAPDDGSLVVSRAKARAAARSAANQRAADSLAAQAARPSNDSSPKPPLVATTDSASGRTTNAPGASNTSSAASISSDGARDLPAMTAPVVTPQAMPAPGPAVVEAPDANLPMVAPRATARTPAKTRARSVSRWVSLVARDWVVVRAGASKQSRIVASIGPNSHVQLGESRGTWRRIRANGLSGWVEPRSSFVGARSR